jgi:hypothetical protein
MDEEPDGLDRVRRQWEHLRIARERAENETLADVTCAICVHMDAVVYRHAIAL